MTIPRSRGRPVLAILRGGRAAHPVVSAAVVSTNLTDENGSKADAFRQQIRRRAGARVLKLANQLVDLAWSEAIDEQLALLREIGWMLVSNGRQDLWRLAYLEFNRGSLYVVGDEARFLRGQPTANPTPLREDDQDAV